VKNEKMKKNVSIYEPDNSIKNGILNSYKEIYNEIMSNRWLIYQLFRRDFSIKYKQSLIGVVWAIIIPFVSIGTFFLMSESGLLFIGNLKVPYSIFSLIGIMLWQLFSTGLTSCSNSLSNAGQMISKIKFSKKSLVISSYGVAIIPFFLQFILLIALFIAYNYPLNSYMLFIPLYILPILLLTLGLGLLISILNAVIKDVGIIVSMSLTFLMLLTPILYEAPREGLLSLVTKYNPIYYLISTPRELMLFGSLINSVGYLISVTFTVMVFLICILIFHLTETRIAERL
jgi:lipopolysaccharide transport system permease protein